MHGTHSAHSQTDTPTMNNSTSKGYSGGKKRTNVSIDGALADIAKKHFPATSYKSLSGFVECALRNKFRALAPRLRKAGFKLPESLFVKA